MKYRKYIDGSVILKIQLDAGRTLSEFFVYFLKSYCNNILSDDPTFPILTLVKTDSYKKNNLEFTVFYTYPFNNHPFLAYRLIRRNSSTTPTYHLVMALGNRIGQTDVYKIYPALPYMTPTERLALAELTRHSIMIRQQNLATHPKYSVFNCYIVPECSTQVANISATPGLSDSKKKTMIDSLEEHYFYKIGVLLRGFFDLLEAKDYKAAERYLRGEYNRFLIKQGVNEFFINAKDLSGHLEIFIGMYQLLHVLITYT